jgi:hypothetical protein
MVARPTVVARTNIGSVKIALAIHPTRYRPATALMAIAILFTDDFNLSYGFRTRNRVRLSQDRHSGSSGHIKNGGSCENCCSDQCRPLYVPGSPRAALALRILKRSAAPINWMTRPQSEFPDRPSTFRGRPGRQGYFRKSVGAGLVDRQALPKQISWTGHTAARIQQGYSGDLFSRQTPSLRFARIPRFHKSRRRRTPPGTIKIPAGSGYI